MIEIFIKLENLYTQPDKDHLSHAHVKHGTREQLKAPPPHKEKVRGIDSCFLFNIVQRVLVEVMKQ